MKRTCLVIICTIFLFSCGIDSTRKKKDRLSLVKELTRVQTDSLRVVLDSTCIKRKENEFDILVDSTLDARLDKIKEKLKEYHK